MTERKSHVQAWPGDLLKEIAGTSPAMTERKSHVQAWPGDLLNEIAGSSPAMTKKKRSAIVSKKRYIKDKKEV